MSCCRAFCASPDRPEVRPDIGAAFAARCAGELRFEIRQPDIIVPLIAADLYRVAAFIIRTIDQEIAHAGCAHFGERDFLGVLQRKGPDDLDTVR
jgi:hypothetical protein